MQLKPETFLIFPLDIVCCHSPPFQETTPSSMGNHPSIVKHLKSATEFSYAEINEWYKGFIKDCASGLITMEEFKTMYTILFPNGDASGFAEHVFSTFDANGDHSIDFKEFLCAMSITSRGKTDEKLEWVFNMYDMDRDGFITQREMLGIITSMSKMVGVIKKMPDDEFIMKMPDDEFVISRMKKIFRQMDTDRNGQVSLHEFIEGARDDPDFCKLADPTLHLPWSTVFFLK